MLSYFPLAFRGGKPVPKKSVEGKEGSLFPTLVMACRCQIRALFFIMSVIHIAVADGLIRGEILCFLSWESRRRARAGDGGGGGEGPNPAWKIHNCCLAQK